MIDINKQLAKRSVSSRYGAPMGRREYVNNPIAEVWIQRVQFEDGDYDKGGAYWGGNSPLYCCMDAKDEVLLFIRAETLAAAREVVLRLQPDLVVQPNTKK